MESLCLSSPNVASLTNGSYASKPSLLRRKTQVEYKFLKFRQSNLNHSYKYIGGGSTQENNEKYILKVTAEPHSNNVQPHVSYTTQILDFAKNILNAFVLFSSPHPLVAYAISLISASLLAVEKPSDLSQLFFIGVLKMVVPHMFFGVYVAGINQLTDVEIDKINKPHLPLVSGKVSSTATVIVIASCLTLSLLLGWNIGSWPLMGGLLLNIVMWSAYSFNGPLLRWKRHPILSAMVIFSSWTISSTLSAFLHIQTFVFKRPAVFSKSLISAVAFMSLYSVGIALCKDIPDVEGDIANGVESFAALFGQKRIFWTCVSLFEMAFGVAFLAGATSPSLLNKFILGVGNALLASVLWYQAKSTDLRSKKSISSFFLFSTKLLYAEYLLMPLVR